MPSYLSPGVYMEEVSSGSRPIEAAGTAVAAFVGFAEKGPLNQPTLVTNWTQFSQNFGGFIAGSYLAHSVYGYFANGGGSAYVVRVGTESVAEPAVFRGEVPAVEDGRTAFAVRALPAAAVGPGPLTVEVVGGADPADETFTLLVKRGGAVVEAMEGLTVRRGPANVATAVRQQSKLIEVEETRGARVATMPRQGVEVAIQATGNSPAVRVEPNVYVGNSADRTGFAGLEAIDEITMLSVPDLMAARDHGLLDDEGVRAVQDAMITHCELMRDRIAILDTPAGLNAQGVKNWRAETNYDSKYAALYWPWIKVMDPLSGRPSFVPPSGHMAGIWARNDATRGVHKAPANEVVRGAIELEL
jgi:phage tail sheath protein FI